MKLTQIEGKSPHKKGSAKYKKHMAAKHASMSEKVDEMKSLVERAKHVRANSKKPKIVKPNTGHESPHPYDNAGFVGEAELDEISMQDIKKGAKVAAVTGAIALGGAGIGKVADYMNQSSYDYSIQLPQLEMYLDYAEAQKDQRMIKQLKTRIRNHEGRLSMGGGDLDGRDGTPMSFEVVYDKENPNFDPLGDPMQLNKKFKDARDNMPESKKPELPKQNNPVAKNSRNMSGAGAHKSPKDYDRKNKKAEIKSQMDEAPYSADKTTLLKAVIDQIENKAQDEDGIKLLKKLAQLVGKKIYKRDNGKLALESPIPFNKCPSCGGDIHHIDEAEGKKDACYHKVKSRYKVWPSAYASGALVQCRKKGAKNWGNSKKK